MAFVLIAIFTLILLVVCAVMAVFILMQKPNADAGMGAGLGGGAAESVFGGEAGNVLTKVTVRCIVAYFVIAFGLYLGYIYIDSHKEGNEKVKTTVSALEATKADAPSMPEKAPAQQAESAESK